MEYELFPQLLPAMEKLLETLAPGTKEYVQLKANIDVMKKDEEDHKKKR